MAGNLATFPNSDTFLNFNKVANPGLVVDLAPIEIDVAVNADVFSELYVRGDLLGRFQEKRGVRSKSMRMS